MRNPRSVALCVLLCFLTTGIFSLIWMYLLAKDMEELAPEGTVKAPLVVLFSCLSCFLYDYYWGYTVAKILESHKSSEKQVLYSLSSQKQIVYSLLSARFALGILIFCLGFLTMGMLWGYAMFSSVLMLGRIQKEVNQLVIG